MTRHLEAAAVVAFDEELRSTLPEILAALDAAEHDPANVAAVRETHRLVHSLKGAASMVGLAALGYLLNQAEDLIDTALTDGTASSPELLEIVRASVPQFSAYMVAALAGQPLAPIAARLARGLRRAGADADAASEASLLELVEIDARELASRDAREPADDDPSAAPADAASEIGGLLPVFDGPPLISPDLIDLQAEIAPPPDAWAATFHEEILGLREPEPEPAPDDAFAPPVDPFMPPASAFMPPVDAFVSPADAFLPSADAFVPPADAFAPSIDTFAPSIDTFAPPIHTFAPPALRAPDGDVDESDLDLAPADALPQELAEVFAQEAQEHLQSIAQLTSRLVTVPDDADSLQDLRRAVHTLKGAAGVVGYKAASRMAHRMEDLLDRLYEGTAVMTPEATRVLASSSDALGDLISGESDSSIVRETMKRLFRQFDALIGQAAPTAPPAAAPPFADAVPAPPRDVLAAAPAIVEEAAPEPEAPAAPKVERRRGAPERRRGTEDRRGGQTLRVPFHRLNELVRLMSELVINRSTFDQHYSALVEQMNELKLSTARLRRVAQKLEADYEVRALAGNIGLAAGGRNLASSSGGEGFDELEFDRYTEFHLLTRELTETASDIGTVSTRVSDTIGDFDGDLTRLGRLTREIQDRVMAFRMVPLGTLTSRLERTIRMTAAECGKSVDFHLEGEGVALDKSLLEEMADPLLHLLRNAVDHGIESAAVRATAGKPERGRVAVRAYHQGTDVIIEVEDDGRGLDLERIRRTAVDRGYVGEAEAATLSADALSAFLFEPGFSTASRISEISGRGVGLDIVKAKVLALNGRIQITSQPGKGARMSVRVPMTLAIARILLIRAGGETFGLPLGTVVQILRPYPSAIAQVGSEKVVTVDGRTYPMRDLADTLGLSRPADPPSATQPILIVNLAGRLVALVVDEIVHSRDAVVKTLGTHLRRVRAVWGATLLGDGTVVLILNPADLAGAAEAPRVRRMVPRALPLEHSPYSVLIVDDSLSIRHVLSSVVEKAGWLPVQARDGVEAFEALHRATRPPDIVLLDIEMPRMDGFEFLATCRAQKAYSGLPIVMLTSRGGEKHREKAKALGVTEYMVKPFQEDALVETIDRLVKVARRVDRRAAS